MIKTILEDVADNLFNADPHHQKRRHGACGAAWITPLSRARPPGTHPRHDPGRQAIEAERS